MSNLIKNPWVCEKNNILSPDPECILFSRVQLKLLTPLQMFLYT
jgi:hypothetical protein